MNRPPNAEPVAPARNSKVVGIVAPFPPPYGGMSVQADRLVRALEGEGCPVCAIRTNPPPPERFRWARAVPGLRTLIRETQYLVLLFRHLRGCDVVHHFAASGFSFFSQSVPVLLLGRFLKKKVIVNYRGGNAPAFLSRWHRLVGPFLAGADVLAVPSEFLQQAFAHYGLPSVLLPNLADTNSFVWKDACRFAPKLLVTRRLERMYNIECILKAFRVLQSRYPGASLTIAGDGPEEEHLHNLAVSWNLAGVRFYGAVAHSDLPRLYAASDIYVNASNIDNFPGALVEAACCGLPIVTTRAGGIPCMIRDRENGILTDLNDHEALAAGVTEIVEKPEFGRKLALEARRWAEQFSWQQVWATLGDCYGLTAEERASFSTEAASDSSNSAAIKYGELVR